MHRLVAGVLSAMLLVLAALSYHPGLLIGAGTPGVVFATIAATGRPEPRYNILVEVLAVVTLLGLVIATVAGVAYLVP